jgi:chemotaxis protein CheY-P-specific phosphatase CheC
MNSRAAFEMLFLSPKHVCGSIYGLILGRTGNDKKYERSEMITLNGIYFPFSF